MEVYKRQSRSQASSAIERGTVYRSEEQFYPSLSTTTTVLSVIYSVLFLYRLHPAESLVTEGECSPQMLKRGRKNSDNSYVPKTKWSTKRPDNRDDYELRDREGVGYSEDDSSTSSELSSNNTIVVASQEEEQPNIKTNISSEDCLTQMVQQNNKVMQDMLRLLLEDREKDRQRQQRTDS